MFFGSSYHLLIERRQFVRLIVLFPERVLVDNSEKAVEHVSTSKIIGDSRQKLWKED